MAAKRSRMVTGVAWYRREQWTILKSVSVDSDELEHNYENWLRTATRNFKKMEASGLNVEKIDVDVMELIVWCASSNKTIDAAARIEFVISKRPKGTGREKRKTVKRRKRK